MKVLLVTHHYLDSNGGGTFASRAFINAFSEISDELMLLYPDNNNEISSFLNPKINKRGVYNKASKLAKLLDIYTGKINRFSGVFFSTVDEYNPDVVVFDNSRSSAGYIKGLEKRGIDFVTIHHNYEMEYYLGNKPPVLWRYPFLYFMKKTEKKAVLKSKLNLTLTKADVELLQTNYDFNRIAKFKSIGVFEYKPNKPLPVSTQINKKEITFIISGNLGALQTQTTLASFLRNEYAILKDSTKKMKLIIAGKNPSKKLKEICALENIKLIANPENMEAIISQADIYICPVFLGGGLKLRVMDGLKLGLPVLTHKVSARGYEKFKENEMLFVYEDTKSFAKQLSICIESYCNKYISKQKVQDLYVSEFSFNNGVKRLKKALNEL